VEVFKGVRGRREVEQTVSRGFSVDRVSYVSGVDESHFPRQQRRAQRAAQTVALHEVLRSGRGGCEWHMRAADSSGEGSERSRRLYIFVVAS
jgi:hypothetical protein